MIVLLKRRLLAGLAFIPLFFLGGLIGSLAYTTGRSGMVIMIDPGHGGIDGGCQDLQGHLEKDVNLAIAKLLAAHLRKAGINPVLTRQDDRTLGSSYMRDLGARLEKAKNAHPRAMISIHANWYIDPSARGALAVVPPASPESDRLAKAILSRLLGIAGTRADPVIMPDHPLLAQETFPIVLVEAGFLSNPDEAALLQKVDYQDNLAASIAGGVLEYLGMNDR